MTPFPLQRCITPLLGSGGRSLELFPDHWRECGWWLLTTESFSLVRWPFRSWFTSINFLLVFRWCRGYGQSRHSTVVRLRRKGEVDQSRGNVTTKRWARSLCCWYEEFQEILSVYNNEKYLNEVCSIIHTCSLLNVSRTTLLSIPGQKP